MLWRPLRYEVTDIQWTAHTSLRCDIIDYTRSRRHFKIFAEVLDFLRRRICAIGTGKFLKTLCNVRNHFYPSYVIHVVVRPSVYPNRLEEHCIIVLAITVASFFSYCWHGSYVCKMDPSRVVCSQNYLLPLWTVWFVVLLSLFAGSHP